MTGTKRQMAPGERLALAGLLLLGLLPVLGRFASPTQAWGIHLTGYLPLGGWIAAVVGWALLFVPPWRRLVERLLYDRLAVTLFTAPPRRAWLPIAGVLTVAAAVFWLLSTPTHLLGDGVMVGEMVGRGARFRATDGMDYLLHRLVHDAVARTGDVLAAYGVYAGGSRLAGIAGVLLAILLLRRSRLPVPSRALLLMLWFVSSSTLLFCGYVESYSFLAVALLGFAWSGAMAQRGEVAPWVPGLCFGLALTFHLSALIALPALLWLAARPGPRRYARGPWAAAVLLPALLLPLGGVLAHLAQGFDATWLQREFGGSESRRPMLVALLGDHSLTSRVHWKDLANWLAYVVPVPAWLVLCGASALRRREDAPELGFLLVKTGAFALAFVLMDRKLGAARDWDLFAPHAVGLGWIAVRLWEPQLLRRAVPGPWPALRFAAPWVALLIAWPWFAVNASRPAALKRFEEIITDFGPYQRGYAAQDIAKYHRDRGDHSLAVRWGKESVRVFPRSMRFHALLGADYVALGRLDEAERAFDEALRIQPADWTVFDMRAKLALRRGEFATARALYERQSRLVPGHPEVWWGVGYAALQLRDFAAAREAMLRACSLRSDPQYDYLAGIACASLGRWDEAVERFGQAMRDDPQGRSALSLAMVLEAREAARRAAGGGPDSASLKAAAAAAERAASLALGDPQVVAYRDHVVRVAAGLEPPAPMPR